MQLCHSLNFILFLPIFIHVLYVLFPHLAINQAIAVEEEQINLLTVDDFNCLAHLAGYLRTNFDEIWVQHLGVTRE